MNKTMFWAMGVMAVWILIMFVISYFMDHPGAISNRKCGRAAKKAKKAATAKERREAEQSCGIMFRSVRVFKRSGWRK